MKIQSVTTKIILLIILVFTTFFVNKLLAEEYFQIGKHYRAIAMGNTGIASANGAYALSYNPAALANLNSFFFDLGYWTVEASKGLEPLEVIPTIGSVTYPYLSEDGLQEDQRGAVLEKTDPYLRAETGISIGGNLSKEGFSMAANYSREMTLTTLNDNQQIYQRYDQIFQYGASIPLGVGQWIIGASRKQITRKEASGDSTSVPTWSEKTTGIGYDVGILFRMANVSRLTFGLVAHNYGNIKIGEIEEAETEEISMGMTANWDSGVFRFVPAIDIRGLTSKRERKNRIHMGAELGIFPYENGGSMISLRSGLNQGYPTNGAELNFFERSMIFGYAEYTEEIGTADEKKGNNRKVFYFSYGW